MTEDERRQAAWDRATLGFIAAEIMTGTTFAGVADVAYGMRNLVHAFRVHGEAEKAYTVADMYLARATARGLDTVALTGELAVLRKVLDALPARGGTRT